MSAEALDLLPPRTGILDRLAGMRRAWLTMDSNEAVIRFVSQPAGIVVIHLAFIAGLFANMQFGHGYVALVAVALAGCAIFPQRRLLVISLASLAFLVLRPMRTQAFYDLVRELGWSMPQQIPPAALQGMAALVVVMLAFAWLQWQGRAASTALSARRPLLVHLAAFHVLLVAGLFMARGTALHAGFWIVMSVWASSFWVMAYMMADLKARTPTNNLHRAAYLRPIWGGSATPIGKGHGYLSKFEARTEEDLAITRIKALKLVVWAALLHAAYLLLNWLIHVQAGIPTLHMAVMAQVEGEAYPLTLRWTGLIATYFLDLVIIAYWGHAVVAIVRMIGFRIPRNTVNPLASRTLAEFWNRYFFYYKELLVDFFFYPAFLRWFKKTPKLRIAFATFCAAGLGNFIYHFMSEIHVFALLDLSDALSRFPTFAFYVCVLSAGLIVSQIRGRKLSPQDGFFRYDVLPRLNVMLFFCFLKIFDDIFGNGSLADRLDFFLGLFGVSQ